ncbi:MAG: peroxiredoxin [Hyphomicrobiaceae bacterium]
MLEEGQNAPAFKLPADSEETISLKSLKGSVIVLFFYPKDDTAGCTKEAIAFTEHLERFENAGAIVIGMSPDGVESHKKFKAKHDLRVTLLSDVEKSVLQAYGVWVEKSMYGRKYMGVERTTFVIDHTGKIKKVWRKVKVPGHVESVLEFVESIA